MAEEPQSSEHRGQGYQHAAGLHVDTPDSSIPGGGQGVGESIEQIRLAEAEVARRLAAAGEVAEKSLAKAHEQAAEMKVQAVQAGRQEGEQRYQALVAEAQAQATEILARAQEQAAAMERDGAARLEGAVSQAVQFILGELGGSPHER